VSAVPTAPPGSAAPAATPAAPAYSSSVARLGALELAYDVFGEGQPLLLIMGIGAQRIFWDDELCRSLAARGFQVIRFDHRDVGQSSSVAERAPGPAAAVWRRLIGRPIAAPYTLSDMANDAVGLLDHLGLASAHLVGISMGGMIAQHLAIEHPARVRSLVSISSTPGSRRYLPDPSALRALFRRRPRDEEEAADAIEFTFGIIGSRQWPSDRERLRNLGRESFRRGANPAGFFRHFAALLASGNRLARLASVTAPTLVIHGTLDPLIPFAAGRATARAIPGARFLPVAGMAHDLPQPLWPMFVDAIVNNAARARRAEPAEPPASTRAPLPQPG
jgi:pimeloyl-ACP methyl ester carboxylesterase